MGKRKRETRDEGSRRANTAQAQQQPSEASKASLPAAKSPASAASSETIQIITGSYDRVLHGFTASFSLAERGTHDDRPKSEVHFADTFMFNAHASAIRCLALSPLPAETAGTPSRVTLASGGSDERINLYSVSANAPPRSAATVLAAPTLETVAREENSRNREIGNLIHHSSNITQLCFATKSKLLSSSEDNTVAVSRTRDWTVLSTFKAPLPKIQGRPSGDTAPPGGAPAGVNDFSIHPSMKIMISVSKGERCMRLWDLVKGNKAGTLDFERSLLQAVGESRHSTGEARSILFSPDGEEFVVSFDRGAVVFDMQSQIKGLVLPTPRTKFHKMRFLPGTLAHILAVSADDGRVLFFDVRQFVPATSDKTPLYRTCQFVAQLGGPTEGVATRVKSFQVVQSLHDSEVLFVVTACSDGSTRVWSLDTSAVSGTSEPVNGKTNGKEGKLNGQAAKEETASAKQVGTLLGRYDTANRITCMEAFTMLPQIEEERVEKLSNGHGKANGNNAIVNGASHSVEGAQGQDEIDGGAEDEFSGFD